MTKHINIKFPIWNTRSVGIADYKIVGDITVGIEYKRKGESERLYPDTYFMKKDKAKTYPIQDCKGVKLRIIPIGDFDVLEEK